MEIARGNSDLEDLICPIYKPNLDPVYRPPNTPTVKAKGQTVPPAVPKEMLYSSPLHTIQ